MDAPGPFLFLVENLAMAEPHSNDSPPPSAARGLRPFKTTTKQDLIARISEQTRQPRARVKRLLHALLRNMIIDLQAGHRIELREFGVFEVKQRAARIGRNPRTLERIPVPPRRSVRFKIGRLMKSALESDGQAVFTLADFDEDEDDTIDDDAAGTGSAPPAPRRGQ